ncbi:MAG TPA: hypothetical protein VFI10_04240 [Gaiellaceae bacterium]|nr:hypothetical protein [Gaiellaceae bacterium]
MNGHDTTTRDEELGALLRELDAPEHRPEFHAALRQQLRAERTAATRRTRVRWGLRLAAAAAVLAGVIVAVGLPRGSNVATAAVVQERLRSALVGLQNLSGTLVEDGPAKGDAQRWQFVLDTRGDLRLEGPGKGEVMTYDASAGVVRSAQRSASMGGGTLFYAERSGVAPGLPDQGPPSWMLPGKLGAFVRAALAAGDPGVHEIDVDGRPAWRLDVDTVPNAVAPELSADRFSITVDRQTGMPIRVVETRNGNFLRELAIENLAVDTDLAGSTFRFAFPPGADVMRSDDGFRRVTLAEAARIVGYAPLVPAWLPDGYRLAEVAVAREAGPTGAEGGNPPSREVVSLAYRRGLDQLLVTTRLRGDARWADPLATGEGFVDHPQTVTIGNGALAGTTAELLIRPRGIPHIWAQTPDLVVTIGGDASRAELLRVAGSLDRR